MKHLVLWGTMAVGCTLLFVQSALGHAGTDSDQTRNVLIKGRVVNGQATGDTLQLIFLKVDVFIGTVGADTRELITNRAGAFECQLPAIDHPGRISLLLKGYQAKYVNTNDALYGYMVEPGDQVFIEITRRPNHLQYTFTGTGAAKYACRRSIDLLEQQTEMADSHRLADPDFWGIGNWTNRCRYADSLAAKKIAIVQQYKKSITPTAGQLLQADITGSIRHRYVANFYSPDYVAKNNATIIQTYRAFVAQATDTVNGALLTWSPDYVRYLMYRSLLHLFIRSGCDERYNIPSGYAAGLKDWYMELKQRYSGPLRDVLLMSLLTNNLVASKDKTYDSCLMDALTVIRTPEIKDLANRWSTIKRRGSPAYNFTLVDTGGAVVRLSDLKGKLVLIDIWFTGCNGCRALAKEFKENLYPHFANNKAVAFVSISGDRDRNTWLTSVREEKYTVTGNINLFTNGAGFDDPFMKYYDFVGGPYLMIVDREGKIFTCAPPHTGSDLTVLLNQALLE